MKYFSIALASLAFWSCGSSEKEYIQFPADTLVRDLDSVKNYSIILYDMDVTEDDKCMHKYKIVKRSNNAPEVATTDSTALAQTATAAEMGFEEKITDWMPVSQEDFDFHSSDMGMEIVSKVNGEVSKVAAPPGYSQYVGNEKYGHWQSNSSGESFWSFYGKYMFISSMFNLMSPVSYGYYGGYGAYRGVSPYYGPQTNGRYAYGTGSTHASGMNADYDRRASTNPKLSQRVQNSIGSSSRATGGQRTAATTPSSRTSHSSTRYSSSSRSRTSGSSGGK